MNERRILSSIAAAGFFLLAGECAAAPQAASPPAAPSVTRLSLKQAVEMALAPGTAASQTAQTAVDGARGKVFAAQAATSLVAQAALADRMFRVDLRSLGIDIPRFSQLISTIQFPGATGPYSLFDPRIQAAKTLIDKSAKRRIAAAKEGIEEAKGTVREEREKIAAETARVYFEAVRASEQAELAARNLRLAETMVSFAQERHTNGLGVESEVRRAKIDVSAQGQKVAAARLDQTRAVLRLLYLVGGDFAETLELTEPEAGHAAKITLEQAIADALKDSPALATLQLHDEGLKLSDRAISATRLPVVNAYGDFGMTVVAPDPSGASGPSHSFTYTAGVEVKMTVLDGHRRALAHAGVQAELRQQSIRERDLRRQIELNVRLAWAGLAAASEQVDLAEESLKAADADVTEIKASHAAGNASGLDVQQAEARQAATADGRLAAFHNQAQARLALAEAMGKVSDLQW